MRILTLARDLPYFPGGHGGNTRAFCLIRELSRRHRFTVVTNVYDRIHEQAAEQLRRFAERVEYYRGPGLEGPATDAIGSGRSWLERVASDLRSDPARLARTIFRGVVDTVRCDPAEVRLWDLGFENLRPMVERVLRNGHYDVLQIECSENARWARYIAFDGPTLLSIHDVQTVVWWRRFRSATTLSERVRALNQVARFFVFERRSCRRFDGLIAMSDVDRRWLALLTGHPSIFVVPNGVDTVYYAPGQEPAMKRVVFAATMNHPPNHDGILYFAREIWPLIRAKEPDAYLDIVGSNPPPDVVSLADARVQVTGFVPDTRPYLASARVCICPLRFASGTRLKILDAMAMGKAVVSTAVGAEGIECTPGDDIRIADDPAAFAEAVVGLLRDDGERRRLERNARAVAERYSWSQVATRLDAVYEQVGRSHAARRSATRFHIGLNGMFLVPGGATGGLEPYFHNLVSNLLRLDHDSRYTLLARPANVLEFARLRGGNLGRRVVPTASPRHTAASLWHGLASRIVGRPLAAATAQRSVGTRLDMDLVHCFPGYIEPELWDIPAVLTVADVQHEFHPEFFEPDELAARRALFRPSAVRAVHIITLSQFTRRTLIERYGIAPEKISVIPLGVDTRFFGPATVQRIAQVRQKYRVPESYCIYAANLWPHKNHPRLLAALASLPAGRRPHLVLTGSPTRTQTPLRQTIREHNLEGDVSWLGFVDGNDLPPLFAGARMMVFPSLFEGFGMPVVEAMAASCPVACADTAALPEVVADAALQFDPFDATAIAAAMERLWNDDALRTTLRAAGRARARQFTWIRTALQTLQVYRAAAVALRTRPVAESVA